jgi:hypothetical protein
VLFVHGLLGAAFKTWRQKDCDGSKEEAGSREDYTECWPQVRPAPLVVFAIRRTVKPQYYIFVFIFWTIFFHDGKK